MYSVRTTINFQRQFKKLDKFSQKMIKAWINNHLVGCDNPRATGKALTGNLKGEWRYRIGNYRLLCIIKDAELIIETIKIGHRRDVYD